MKNYIIVVRCKNCKNQMQTVIRGYQIKGYTKCVYCGKSINRKEQLVRRINF